MGEFLDEAVEGRDWTSLPEDLLHEAVFSLLSFQDKVSFRDVCTISRSAADSKGRFVHMSEEEFCVRKGVPPNNRCSFHSEADKKSYFRSSFPELGNKDVVATIDGWWLLVEQSQAEPKLSFDLQLFNPCTRLNLHLPMLQFELPIDIKDVWFFVPEPPASLSCSVWAVVQPREKKLFSCTWKKGDVTWTNSIHEAV